MCLPSVKDPAPFTIYHTILENNMRICQCGSGKESWAEYDARGIFLCHVCEECREEKLSHFRPDVLTDPNYWHDEPIDEE
jgi:hypothetical protein